MGVLRVSGTDAAGVVINGQIMIPSMLLESMESTSSFDFFDTLPIEVEDQVEGSEV